MVPTSRGVHHDQQASQLDIHSQSFCNGDSSMIVQRMTHIIGLNNTQHQSQVYTAATFNSRLALSLLHFPRPPFSLIRWSETRLLSHVGLGIFTVRD